ILWYCLSGFVAIELKRLYLRTTHVQSAETSTSSVFSWLQQRQVNFTIICHPILCQSTVMVEPLMYLPFETFVDTGFWHLLAKKKLDEYRLSEGPFGISAEFSNTLAAGLTPRVSVDISAFPDNAVKRITGPAYRIQGKMTTFNSLDEFKNFEKQPFINKCGQAMFKVALEDNEYLRDPEKLMDFQLLTYCDLKHYKFYFWFAYPAVISDPQPVLLGSRLLDEEFSESALTKLLVAYDLWRQEHRSAFFAIKAEKSMNGSTDFHIVSCAGMRLDDPHIYLAFCDPSTHGCYPGWPLRNMLFALSATLVQDKQRLRVVCFRERFYQGQRSCNHSLVLQVELCAVKSSSFTQFVGWEKCDNQLKPRFVNLSASMDPLRLSESAIDLNLKLMKWRLVPDLRLETVRETKCLLIGAGTLGCNVSRQLLAWGVRHITFVDNANVSLSNPVRQSLFVFEDTKNGGSPKASAAAHALLKISPGVTTEGFQLSIPMPGHPVSNRSNGTATSEVLPNKLGLPITDLKLPPRVLDSYIACSRLSELISYHDVVFLLTDTRESRWLPTLLANVHGKLVINAALGFDTYLVMRHGRAPPGVSPGIYKKQTHTTTSPTTEGDTSVHIPPKPSVDGGNLGCYFCNDVVGPTNSTQNRSLDQQCTVTRPGVSLIASALAVELLVNVLQHPKGPEAPAATSIDALNGNPSPVHSSFGLVPHQIRGFLPYFGNVLPATSAFSHCSGCSQAVLDAYQMDGFRFLLRVFDDADYLELVCGLKQLHQQTESNDVIALSQWSSLKKLRVAIQRQTTNVSDVTCQRCLEKGHWTFQCKGKRKYLERESYTCKLGKKLESIQQKKARSKASRHRQSSSSSSTSSSSDQSSTESSDSSDTETFASNGSSSSQSDSDDDSASSGTESSDSASENSGSETNSEDSGPKSEKKRKSKT
ncbi:e1-like protein-activating enzyme Gsa7p/Apg7p, partial [Opisthorchis viverrini]